MKLLITTLALVAAVSAVYVELDNPMCRQTYINETTGEEHLVTRGDGTSTGCMSHMECTMFTAPDSWCKSDGTCRGCDESTGCCDLGNPAPPVMISCNHEDRLSDWVCAVETGCGNSYCREDNTCHQCDSNDDAPSGSSFHGASGWRSVGALIEAVEQSCKANTQCPTAHIVNLDVSEIAEVDTGGSYRTDGFQICEDACDGAEPGYTYRAVFDCKLDGSDNRNCPRATGCSHSYCKPSGESRFDYGMCHLCVDDPDAPPAPATVSCSGTAEADHEQCRIDTGCSASYCKGSVCKECPDDGFVGPPIAPPVDT